MPHAQQQIIACVTARLLSAQADQSAQTGLNLAVS